MRVLVSAASRHGATTEIADVLGAVIAAEHAVTVTAPDEVVGLEDHDAFVLGSAVYAGHWLDPAHELVETHADVLAGRARVAVLERPRRREARRGPRRRRVDDRADRSPRAPGPRRTARARPAPPLGEGARGRAQGARG
ncbi:MAG: flavodoxin domain-containing protein [Acidimicrobiia bacterium]|nr:flavodoxin domain-containing protein [Acidimicrobiia bacterium]